MVGKRHCRYGSQVHGSFGPQQNWVNTHIYTKMRTGQQKRRLSRRGFTVRFMASSMAAQQGRNPRDTGKEGSEHIAALCTLQKAGSKATHIQFMPSPPAAEQGDEWGLQQATNGNSVQVNEAGKLKWVCIMTSPHQCNAGQS